MNSSSNRFDLDVLKTAIQNPVARVVVFQYFKCLFKATLLGRKAKDEDQVFNLLLLESLINTNQSIATVAPRLGMGQSSLAGVDWLDQEGQEHGMVGILCGCITEVACSSHLLNPYL